MTQMTTLPYLTLRHPTNQPTNQSHTLFLRHLTLLTIRSGITPPAPLTHESHHFVQDWLEEFNIMFKKKTRFFYCPVLPYPTNK